MPGLRKTVLTDLLTTILDGHGPEWNQEPSKLAWSGTVDGGGQAQVTMPSSATTDRLYPHGQGFLAEAVA